ncbi:hypothetical protein VUR80DRAFT_8263 [Thermomyces stellatus]
MFRLALALAGSDTTAISLLAVGLQAWFTDDILQVELTTDEKWDLGDVVRKAARVSCQDPAKGGSPDELPQPEATRYLMFLCVAVGTVRSDEEAFQSYCFVTRPSGSSVPAGPETTWLQWIGGRGLGAKVPPSFGAACKWTDPAQACAYDGPAKTEASDLSSARSAVSAKPGNDKIIRRPTCFVL